jgi:hypothetical protein
LSCLSGNVHIVRTFGGYTPLPFYAPFDLNPPGDFYWVDNNSLYGSNTVEGVFSQVNTYIYTDNENVLVDNRGINLITQSRAGGAMSSMTKMDEEEWKEGLAQAYEDVNVPDGHRLDLTTLAESYPSEEEWCGGITNDPACTESPFQEPEAKVNAGAIAGFTILGIFILVYVMYVFHRRLMEQQKARVKQ